MERQESQTVTDLETGFHRKDERDGHCRLCGSAEVWKFFEARTLPLQDGVLWPTEREALDSPTGDVLLVFCRSCSYIDNLMHDTARMTFAQYNFSLHSSPAYGKFITALATSLVERYHLQGKTVLDIGSGGGHFLRELCAIGGNSGTGIDPSCTPATDETPLAGEVKFIRDYYTPAYADLSADFVTCRHLLDELENPREFLGIIRTALRGNPSAVVYVEVPNALHTFGGGVVWNVGCAKRSWFTTESLSCLFTMSGFQVLNAGPCYNGEYLGIEARPSPSAASGSGRGPSGANGLWPALREFDRAYRAAAAAAEITVAELRSSGKRIAAWGTGARAINYFSRHRLGDIIPYVVDINPRRQGMYLPVTAQRVVSPAFLRDYRPDLILITNAAYEGEIRDQATRMGVTAEFMIQ